MISRTKMMLFFVWYSYNVHGNEANSTETAMKVLFDLASSSDNTIINWLENMVIILDPCLNPDGRDRYVNHYNQVANLSPNPRKQTREHKEGWLAGRENHYHFDLNRDWVWQTQKESQQRLELYHQWMPQVHVDFHEQFLNSNYYFAPASKPYHEVITPWQVEFQEIAGRYNAEQFDQYGWLYFTKEVFDLFYPGYGDTYPTFNGAIGMTYEMPGHGESGLAILRDKGDTLTLSKRIDMHYTTSMATLKAAYEQREKLISNFTDYFQDRIDKERKYIIRSSSKDRLDLLKELLDKNRISYFSASASKAISAFSHDRQQTESLSLRSEDLVIPADQPKSRFVKVLFERSATLPDSLTYDITAWSLPFTYGVEGYYYDGKLDLSEHNTGAIETSENGMSSPYVYLSPWSSVKDARFLAELLNEKFKVSYTTRKVTIGNEVYPAGSLLIPRIDNKGSKFIDRLPEIAAKHERDLVAVSGGLSASPYNLGSGKMVYLKKPRIAMLAGKGIETESFGELWHYFEQELGYLVDIIELSTFATSMLSDYEVLVLPSGKYQQLGKESNFAKIDAWIKQGGRLILMEKAIDSFIGKGKFSLEKRKLTKEDSAKTRVHPFETAEREQFKKEIRGGIIKTKIDNTHPIAFGYDNAYYTLKNRTQSYQLLKKGWNVCLYRIK